MSVLRPLGHLASALLLGPAWLVLLIVGWATGFSMIVTLVGVFVLLGLAHAARGAGDLERRLAAGLLDVRVPRPPRPVWRGSVLGSLRAWVTDPGAWREQAYLVLRFLLGVPLAAVLLGLIGGGVQLMAAVAYYRWAPPDIGVAEADTLGEALLCIPLGAAAAFIGLWLVRPAAAAWRPIARTLLTMSDRGEVERAPRMPGATPALRVHAYVTAGIVGLLTFIWLLTTPGGYFWPGWAAISLAVPLAVHAVVAWAPRRPRTRGLAIHAGIALTLWLYLVMVWVLSTPGDHFWPAWVALPLAGAVGVHALVVRGGDGGDRREMAERIDVLTATRAGAVDQQAAELRRIERDLHDGAQARLVALAMDLGMARERLSDDPDAQALVAGAHEQAKRAITELRDLARGIHPVVLTDRGLPAALATLAGASHIPVELDVTTGERPAAAVEAAAYFVVAEALTNVNKHSGATRAVVNVARTGPVMRVRVSDDGAGGADPDGQGLRGLRHRVEALDGVMRVDSPPGGGTVVSVELPCGS
jgi:signal transduction histidine kinase